MFNKRHAILALCIMLATMGISSAWQGAWTSGTGQPAKITGDGQNILVAANGTVKEINPSGSQLWSLNTNVNNNGEAMKAGKYIFAGEGNSVKALNKNDGPTKWTSASP